MFTDEECDQVVRAIRDLQKRVGDLEGDIVRIDQEINDIKDRLNED